jgi:hypothetical protein
MSRLVHRPIVVKLKEEELYAFVDRDFTHVISRFIDSWMEACQWWADEPSHHLYTVVTTHNYCYDIERVGNEWFIYRVWD